MNRKLFSILFTIIIVAVVLCVWLTGRQNGWFIHQSAKDFDLCRNEGGDTLFLNLKNTGYGIAGWGTSRYNDDILHVDIKLNRGSRDKDVKIHIDTANVRYLDMCGKILLVKQIPLYR